MDPAARRAIPLAVAAIAFAGFPPAAGAAPAAELVEMKNGTLEADGAAVRLPTTFSCPAGYEGFLTAQIVQALGKKFAVGFDSAARTCTGDRQKITFYIQSVPAGENTRPFEPGEASARVILDAIDPAASEPFFEEPVAEEPEPALPPLPIGYGTPADEPDDFGPAPEPSVHAEDRSTIRLRER